jgi:dTDP-4-dehydrorhamnose 3,5-epimerase
VKAEAREWADQMCLPKGVHVTPLTTLADSRGDLTELLRVAWHDSPSPLQWNVVNSKADVLRGVHVHKRHWDYFFLVAGEMLFGMHDMRRGLATSGLSVMVRLSGEALAGIVVPPGVAHGFYYVRPSTHVYAVSEYWDMADELGCRWDAPELGLDWPSKTPLVSERDSRAMSYPELVAALGTIGE